MKTSIHSPKVIADPIYGIIDIRSVLPMVEAPEFQALGDKRQLGMSYLIFPSATHTRKAHSIGAYYATQQLMQHWLKLGFVNRREADALAAYALYHDIGHPALSHVTEPLCEMPKGIKNMSANSALSLAIIRRRRHEIEASGVDFKLVERFAAHRNPLHLAVSDKNLGMEKLDYLERDGLCTILSRPAGVDYLRAHIYFADGQLAIDEKAIDNAFETQNFYLKMYKNVYLRKTSAIAQRMIQKIVYHLIREGTIAASDLPDMTDSELFGVMRFSKNETVRKLYDLFKRRDLYREAIVLRPRSFAEAENTTEKEITTFGLEAKQMKKIIAATQLQTNNQTGLAKLENAIAEIAGLPKDSVLIVPVTDPGRFNVQDIMVYRGLLSGKIRGKKPSSLKNRYPAHFKNIEEVIEAYAAFRICTTEKHRAALSSPKVAKKVFELISGQ